MDTKRKANKQLKSIAPVTVTIFINTDEKRVYLSANGDKSTNSYVAANYTSPQLDENFFKEFSNLLSVYKQKFPRASFANVSLVLPDHLFFTDSLTIPNMGKKMVNKSLDLVIDTLFKNKNDLEYHTYLLSQTKQNAVYGLVGARKDLLKNFRDVCVKNGASNCTITFAANAMANSAMAANGKIKSATCLLLDIKEHYARFAFSNKGRTLGSYHLPFGYAMLHNNKLAAEDLLFDYASAELLVLNAKEKAKAKQLTMMEEIELTVVENESEEEVEEVRGGRKLPRFMLRETPIEPNGFVYENFRIFVKWALEVIASNPKITAHGAIDTVYVNLPKEYGFLFDMVNQKKKENKTVFAPMATGDTAAMKMTELSGGFQVNQYNGINNF